MAWDNFQTMALGEVQGWNDLTIITHLPGESNGVCLALETAGVRVSLRI